MGKASKRMYSNMYEGAIEDLEEDLDELSPIKSNKALKLAKKSPAGSSSKQAIPLKSSSSSKPVEATCNKCTAKISGELIGDIFILLTNKAVPLITYTCSKCGHEGKRSVVSLGLPLEQYERKFFN